SFMYDTFFFFKAEDGIRYFHVTGVQTCALPIYAIRDAGTVQHVRRTDRALAHPARGIWRNRTQGRRRDQPWTVLCAGLSQPPGRSEERRVGKEWRNCWVT